MTEICDLLDKVDRDALLCLPDIDAGRLCELLAERFVGYLVTLCGYTMFYCDAININQYTVDWYNFHLTSMFSVRNR